MTREDWMKYPVDFRNWLRQPENRRIYATFEAKAKQMGQLRKHYSARAIIHVIRWETDLRESNILFKCNNNHTPWMARLFMERNPEYEGFFETREVHND